MADSVGQIGLDLVVNKNSFEKQMSGITGLAKKAGAALAAAFAVKKIVDFGASCIELGSDLAEVQNVVDVTFLQMQKQVNDFAKNAAVSFGLSETMAKKFTGTFGAMAKAFGFNEKAAYEMSTALTGLAGDVASFYNISQDEAYTKLKSVFTGETETLKDLGIVMTQSALDSYALANGYGKVTSKMSEAEKVALRYKFVQDQLTLASGDFIRTSDGWANQVRILKLQFDSLKATIGQGLINVLTPVIKVINAIIGKLMSLANAFKAFTDMVTGKKSGGGASVAAAGMEAIADSADNTNAALGGAGGAAKKAAKDIKGASTGIDELNIISPPSESSSGESGGSGGGYSADDFDMGSINTAPVDEMQSKYQGLIDRVKELAGLFQTGFSIGLGDTSVLDNIRSSIDGIKMGLKGIFADSDVMSAAERFGNSISLNLGKVTGSVASVGASIGANFLGGIDKYLSQNLSFIKDRIVNIFNAQADVLNSWGDFSVTFADIFSVLASEKGQQITADIIGIFSNLGLGIIEMLSRDLANVSQVLTQPFIDNQAKIKEALEDTLTPVETVTASIREFVTNTFLKISEVYDKYIDPAFDKFASGWSTIFSCALDAYNQYLLPVLNWISERFSVLVSDYVQPLMDAFLELWGSCVDAVGTFWDFISPFVGWFVERFIAELATQLQFLWTKFEAIFSLIATILTGFMEVLSGVINFIVGVFTGDWKRAWNGIKTIIDGIWNAIKGIIDTAINFVSNIITTVLTYISNTISLILSGIQKTFEAVFEIIKNVVSTIINAVAAVIQTTMDTIKGWITEKLDFIKTKWSEIWGGIKQTTEDIFSGMWNFIKKIINSILSGVETMANGVIRGINKMIDALNALQIEIPEWVPVYGGESFGLNIPKVPEVSIPKLAQGGFVKANTPQLAMIGDNRHQGEVVAPEDKMQEMVNRAVAMVSGNSSMSDQYLSVMIDLLRKIIDLIESMDLTVNIDIREIKQKLVDLDKRAGYTLKTT